MPSPKMAPRPPRRRAHVVRSGGPCGAAARRGETRALRGRAVVPRRSEGAALRGEPARVPGKQHPGSRAASTEKPAVICVSQPLRPAGAPCRCLGYKCEDSGAAARAPRGRSGSAGLFSPRSCGRRRAFWLRRRRRFSWCGSGQRGVCWCAMPRPRGRGQSLPQDPGCGRAAAARGSVRGTGACVCACSGESKLAHFTARSACHQKWWCLLRGGILTCFKGGHVPLSNPYHTLLRETC